MDYRPHFKADVDGEQWTDLLELELEGARRLERITHPKC